MTNNQVPNKEKSSKWEFNAPKFWDLSESIAQNRPSDDWFRKAFLLCFLRHLVILICVQYLGNENISAPSFGAPKRRKQTNAFKQQSGSVKQSSSTKLLHKPLTTTSSTATTTNAEQQQQPTASVFDRLSRESTISFSRKKNQPLTAQQAQHLKTRHEVNLSREINTEPSKETVSERIATLEGAQRFMKPAVLRTKIPLKPAIDKSVKNSSQAIQPPLAPPQKRKTLHEEMQQRSNKQTQPKVIDQEPRIKPKTPSQLPQQQKTFHGEVQQQSNNQTRPMAIDEEPRIKSQLSSQPSRTSVSSPISQRNTITPSAPPPSAIPQQRKSLYEEMQEKSSRQAQPMGIDEEPESTFQTPPVSSLQKSLFEEMQQSNKQAQPMINDQELRIKPQIPVQFPRPSVVSPSMQRSTIQPPSSPSSTRRNTIQLSKHTIAAATVRKSTAVAQTRKIKAKITQTGKKYFSDLMEQNNARKPLLEQKRKQRVNRYFEGLKTRAIKIHEEYKKRAVKNGAPGPITVLVPTTIETTTIATRSSTTSPTTTQHRRLEFSPRKRTISVVGARRASEHIKKAKVEVSKAKEATGEYQPLSPGERDRLAAQFEQ